MYTDYKMNDENVKDYERYERVINTIHKRFKTYGYKRIKTSTFEQYDLYSKVKSSLRQNEMIKVIDRTGEVLVLRPDVTIPITRKLAEDFKELPSELRYFYMQDIYRYADEEQSSIETTQAGIEYFCESSPEADAEVIALACHTLQDLQFKQSKIELGYAGFFKLVIADANLSQSQLSQLKKAIQSKNIVDIDSFFEQLDVPSPVVEVVKAIPFLYGNPTEVIEKARDLVEDEKLHKVLTYLQEVYATLTMYGLEDVVVLDLGLINHMDYYSGVIFQGFVEAYGKPVLMGGRYDELGLEFGANLPAIGFACEVEALLEASENVEFSQDNTIDVMIMYKKECLDKSIAIAHYLRKENFSVVTSEDKDGIRKEEKAIITITNENNSLQYEGMTTTFTKVEQLLMLLEKGKGSM